MIEKGSLWLAMFVITLVLFWLETGSLCKGLGFGMVAATAKACAATIHSRWFAKKVIRQEGKYVTVIKTS